MMPDLPSRRAFVAAATASPVLTLSATLAGPAQACTETPIMRLYRQWEAALVEETAAHTALDGQPLQTIFEAEDNIYATLGAKRREIEAEILAEPATDLRDLAVKVMVNSGGGTFALDHPVILECADLAGRDFAKMPGFQFEEDSAA